mmetsp:Transcript_17940/g.25836  ORF Transcript_17940/g.25836 Transcript_17940/m.25836 type:complete len:81 (-) Transcript_17940:1624-1866(-)
MEQDVQSPQRRVERRGCCQRCGSRPIINREETEEEVEKDETKTISNITGTLGESPHTSFSLKKFPVQRFSILLEFDRNFS